MCYPLAGVSNYTRISDVISQGAPAMVKALSSLVVSTLHAIVKKLQNLIPEFPQKKPVIQKTTGSYILEAVVNLV